MTISEGEADASPSAVYVRGSFVRLMNLLALLGSFFDKCPDDLGSPDRSTRPKLDGPGVTTRAAALPPGALADGDQGHDLRETEKAVCGDRRELFRHHRTS